MSTSTALDAILRGTGLPERMWKAGASHGSAPPPTRQPALSRPDARVPARRSAPQVQTLHQPAAAPATPSPAQPTTSRPEAALEPRQRQDKVSQKTEVKSAPVEQPARPPQLKPVETKKPRKLPAPQPAAFAKFLQDPRPRVRLRGDNRLLSDVASELGSHLAQVLYTHAGEVVELLDGLLHPVSAQRFRTLAERHVTFFRCKGFDESTVKVGASLDEADARGILVSPQFLERLSPIRHINTVRLPAVRPDGRIELLPLGYDRESATLTDAQTDYAEDVNIADARQTIIDLFSEFQFPDGERSRSVAVAALLGLFAKQLVRPGELRAAFTLTKNAEGSGATTLAACCIVPVFGDLPTGVKGGDDDEMRKAITSAIRYGREILILDNAKGKLNSPSLEAFVSAATWTDRLLGSNENVTGENNVTVFVTANGLSISPDWRRRSLFVELHLGEERAEDKVYKRALSVPVLKAMRPQILAACWSLVKNWDESGRPQPSRSHSAFPAWASIIGGIVEAAGFSCPFETARVAIVADEDGAAMRLLVAEMMPGAPYSSSDIVALCRTHSIFDGLVGSNDSEMDRAQRSSFGRLLARYDDRRVNDLKFCITGTGHGKRFHVVGPSEGRPM